MGEATGLTSSDYRSPDSPYSMFHNYKSVSEIINTRLIVPKTLIDVKNAGGTKTYLVLEDGLTLLDAISGNEVKVSELTGRMLLEPTNPGKATAIKNLGATMGSKHQRALIYSQQMYKSGSDITIAKLDPYVIQDMQSQLKNNTLSRRSMLKNAEIDAATISSKAMVSMDIETSMPSKLSSKTKVISAGIGKVIDYRYTLKVGENAMPGLGEFGYLRAEGTTYFNVEMVKAFNDSLSQIGPDTSPKGVKDILTKMQNKGTGGIYGKKQVFEFYEGMWQKHISKINNKTQSLIDEGVLKPKNAKFLNRGETLLDLYAQYEQGATTDGDFYKEFGRRVNKVKGNVNYVLDKFDDLMANDVEYATGGKSWTVGNIVQRTKINIDGPEGTTKSSPEILALKKIRITSDVLYGVAKEGQYYKDNGIHAFTGTEIKKYKELIKTVDIEINSSKKANNEELTTSLIKKKVVVSKMVNKLTDIQGIAKSISSSLMEESNNVFSRSRTTAYEALLAIGISKPAAQEVLGQMSDNIIKPAVTGTSLEDFSKFFNAKELASTKHTGLGDVFTTSNLGLAMVDRFEYEKGLLISEIDFQGPSENLPKGAAYQLRRSSKDIIEISARFSQKLRASQTMKLLMDRERGDKVFTKKLLSRFGKNSKEIESMLVPGPGKKTSIMGFLSEGLEQEMNKIDIQSKPTGNVGTKISSKFKASGSIIGSLLSKRNLGLVIALKMSAYIDNFLQPGETDDHGTHASLETVARRISTVDFGSSWDKMGSSSFKLLKRVGQWMRRGKGNINTLWKTEGSLLRAKESVLIDAADGPYKSFKVALDSSNKRVASLTPKLEQQNERIWTSLKGEGNKYRKIKQNVRNYLNESDMKTPYLNYTNKDKYAYFDMKNTIERHMTSLKTDRGYFFSGSNKLSTTMTSTEMRDSVIGGWNFSTYMKPPSPLMVEYSQLAPVKRGINTFSKGAYYKELSKTQITESKLAKATLNIKRNEEVLGVSSYTSNKLINPVVNVKRAERISFEAGYPENEKLFSTKTRAPVAMRMKGERIFMKSEMYFPKSENRLLKPSNINLTRPGKQTPPLPKTLMGPPKGYNTIPEPNTAGSMMTSNYSKINMTRQVGMSAKGGGLSYHKDFNYMINTSNKRNMYPGSKSFTGAGAPGTSAGLIDQTLYSVDGFI